MQHAVATSWVDGEVVARPVAPDHNEPCGPHFTIDDRPGPADSSVELDYPLGSVSKLPGVNPAFRAPSTPPNQRGRVLVHEPLVESGQWEPQGLLDALQIGGGHSSLDRLQ